MTAISVDPRLRDRRAAVAREAGRRRLRRLVIGAAIVGLLVGAYGLVRSPLLDVDPVEGLTGCGEPGDPDLRRILGGVGGRDDAVLHLDGDVAEFGDGLGYFLDLEIAEELHDFAGDFLAQGHEEDGHLL